MSIVKSKARCPKCRSKNLILIEYTKCISTWEQIDGIIDQNEVWHDIDNIIGIYGECNKCNHKWRFRCFQITNLIEE